MVDSGFDADLLHTLLDAVGAHLESAGASASIIVVGGAALSLRGWVLRTTHDVDVIATTLEAGSEWTPPRFTPELESATQRVARDFHLDANWFNTAIGDQWSTGLPDGEEESVEWLQFRGLSVGLPGRPLLVALKLIASVDQWPSSVHLQDLLALSPTDGELNRARKWVVTQDVATEFPEAFALVIEHVRKRR